LATTQTRTATQTSTLSRVLYVTRKVQADLFALVETYRQVSEEYAKNLIHDLRILLDEEVIDQIRFVWTVPGTNLVIGAYSYKVIATGVGLADDRSGGIGYNSALQQAEFKVRVDYNARWYAMTDTGRAAIMKDFSLSWGPGGSLDYSRGRFEAERTYSKDGYGLGRERFATG
jgi:hypothetical protein